MVGVSVSHPWARALPAGAKLAALAAASLWLFFVTAPAVLGAVLALVLAGLWALGALHILRALAPVGLMIGLAFLAHGLLGDWALGLVVCLRLAILLLLATLVSASTPLAEMLAVLDRLLAPLRRAGVPTRPIGVAVAMTLRFAPMLAARWQGLALAHRARSPRRPGWRLLAPFIISALDDADRAAIALAARGGFDRKED